jgi:hypothetical protein
MKSHRASLGSEPGDRSAPDGEPIRTGESPASIAQSIQDHLHLIQARFPAVATTNDY